MATMSRRILKDDAVHTIFRHWPSSTRKLVLPIKRDSKKAEKLSKMQQW